MRASRGFSLLELIVVVFMLALAMAIIMPTLLRARRPVRRSVCASNLRQLGTAMMMFSDDPANGKFPSVNNDPMLSLNLLYGDYIDDPRVFSCTSRKIPTEKLLEITKIKKNLVHPRAVYLTKFSCTYGYSPDAGHEESRVALAADLPTNHGNRIGWNVLFVGGNVEWRDSALNKMGIDESTGAAIADPDIFAPNPELPREVDSYIRQ